MNRFFSSSPRVWYLGIRSGLVLVFFSILFVAPGHSKESDKPVFTVLFTAEAHAALLPCDCPLSPLGGVSRRASLIQDFRSRGPVVLVDAGGWGAGGMYDEESDGTEERDALRTRLMAEAMGLMGYDAMVWGAEERAWGFLNLLQHSKDQPGGVLSNLAGGILRPVNLDHPPDHRSWPDLISIRRGPVTIEVQGVAPLKDRNGQDLGRPIDAGALSKTIATHSFNLCLAPLGESGTEDLVRANPGFDLVINAGRKESPRVSWRVGQTIVANFDYQSQKLGVAEVFEAVGAGPEGHNRKWDIRVRHEPIRPQQIPDEKVQALLDPHLSILRKKGKDRVLIEYWTMGFCPACKEFRREIEKIVDQLPEQISFEPRFLMHRNSDGSLGSLHGPREMEENRIQALVAKYYPKRYMDWVRWRDMDGNGERSWDEGAKELGILAARIRGALRAGEADAILERDYLLSIRRRIQGTPTLVIANRVYSGEMEYLKILQHVCGLLSEPRPSLCDLVPACFFDAQCRKRGFVGTCLEKGTEKARCDFTRKAVPVPAILLMEKDQIWSNHEQIVEVLVGYLPGLEWKVLDPLSVEGRALVSSHGINRFPAYLLSPVARTEFRFSEHLGNAVKETSGQLALSDSLVGATRLSGRGREYGQADLFVSRFSKDGQQAVDVALNVLDANENGLDLRIHDVVFWKEASDVPGDDKREMAAPGGIGELEETAIGFAVQEVSPGKWHAYLKARSKRRASLYWDRALREADIDQEEIRKRAEGPSESILARMRGTADLMKTMGTGGQVILLGENCELIPVQSRDELQYYLEIISRRTPGRK